MAQLFRRVLLATIGASALAAAITRQPLTAAPETDQTLMAIAASAPAAKWELAQDPPKDKTDQTKGDKDDASRKQWTKGERSELLKRAQVWTATNIPAMDLRHGPERPGAFQPGEEVVCDYVYEKELPGTSRKFNCAITKNDVVKVRYGQDNGKIEGEVLATRLLWALGFGADGVYPVKVRCRGCSANPWVDRQPEAGEQIFDPAAIERKFPGHEIEVGKNDGGWSWKELRHVDERLGGAPTAQLDAMRLLAVFIQHTDNKIINERFVCLPGGLTDGACSRPFLFMHDVGLTFGHANLFDDNNEGSVSFEDWAATPLWRANPKMCVGHMRRSASGMLGDPQISEAGRKFLADLLVQLTDKQLHDLFEVAQVERRSRKPGTEAPAASVDEWVSVFKAKREEIVNNRCEK